MAPIDLHKLALRLKVIEMLKEFSQRQHLRQEAVVQLRLGVCGRMTHRLDRRFHPRALVRPARIVWVRVQPGIADVHV